MSELRADLSIIQKWVKPGSLVLDLGCGDGKLLKYLKEKIGRASCRERV